MDGRTRHLSAVLCLLAFSATASAQVRRNPSKQPFEKLDSALADVVVASELGLSRAAAVNRLRNPLTRGETVPVSIRADDVPGVLGLLRSSRATVANAAGDVVEAYVTPELLRQLEHHQGVQLVTQIVLPQEAAISQGVTVHNASNWQAQGLSGAGVSVGIIDISFQGFVALMGTELPGTVIARCYSAVGAYSSSIAACDAGSNHGTAVAESLMDIAPGVQLYIANPLSYLDMRQTVDWMTAEGVRVINFSVATLWDGPGDGTSPYSDSPLRTIDAAVSAGAMFAVSAGNHANATYFGSFIDTDVDNWAEFPGGDNDNAVYLYAGETLRVQLRWQDTWGGSARDLDLALFDSNYRLLVSSTAMQNGSPAARPFEFLSYAASTSGIYHVGVYRYSGLVPTWIQLQNFSQHPLNYVSSGGSIGSPAETANPGALTVGAAAWFNTAVIEEFSSRGPTPDGRVKPDIVGADRGDTVTYGNGGFAGTSQASPHLAGLAALVRHAHPAYTPAQTAAYLKNQTAPRGSGRPNNIWGFGFAVLPSVCAYSLSPTSASVPAAGSGGAINVIASAPDCPWTASSSAPFVTIIGGSSGTGNGTVTYAVTVNPGSAPRTASLTVGGRTFPVFQAGITTRPRDVNGDGKADLIWRNTRTGGVSAWLMNGPTVTDAAVVLPSVPLAWEIAGVGDVDADSKADLIWRNTQTGEVSVWLMEGTTIRAAHVWGAVPNEWEINGVGDIDGDRKGDLIWRHTQTGDVSAWLLNGTSIRHGEILWFGVPLNWEIAAVSDVDGDGKADLLWRNVQTGDVSVWLMNGTTIGQTAIVWSAVPLVWEIREAADLNGDRKADIVWRNRQTGDVSAWLMNGTTVSEGAIVWSGVPQSWEIATVQDVDGDGRSDLIWRHAPTGDLSAWMMNGMTIREGVVFWAGVPLEWQIQ